MGRRKKEPASLHRKQISEAAHQLFISKSLVTTTMDQIARQAGYSKATLYVYFENKEEIFFYLVHQHYKTFFDCLQEQSKSPFQNEKAWEESYLNICFYLYQLCQEYPLYFDGMISHINVDINSEHTPTIYKEIYQLGVDCNQLIEDFFKQGVELGFLQAQSNMEAVVLFIWGALSGIIRMAVQKKDYYQLLHLEPETFLKEEFLTLLACYKKQGSSL